MKSIAVLISGSGTNLQAIIDACSSGRIPDAEVKFVFSNRKAAYGLTRAQSASPPIPTDTLALQPFLKADAQRTRIDYDLEVARRIITGFPDSKIDLIVLAGFMHVLSEEFLDVISGVREYETDKRISTPIPIINLHPALPGAFDGANAIQRAFEAYQKGDIKGTGVMVHYVVKEVDRGAPILVREVEILPEDDIAALEERMHKTEHALLLDAVKKVLSQEPESISS
ncbi:formyl transferase [Cantharellus anzutake]|uniref:formyl transferase n=1 Tax=Cantharellus anzutake TaxID=1750568 RepID=UPI00190729DA|nr:formyl transferase [Cantharellus anzutake]KAF8337469.1 formyl transferase [Cantharellus anzutake]